MKLQYEGFWKSSSQPDLPMPKEFKTPWKGKDAFLEKLTQIETRAEITAYRGVSICRICRCVNGNKELEYRGWVWPQGFRHYVEAHNIIPTPGFERFVESNWRD